MRAVRRRGKEVLKEVLGEDFKGVMDARIRLKWQNS
jgi:hypothetical protein